MSILFYWAKFRRKASINTKTTMALYKEKIKKGKLS
jgi:hypothetical protein